MKSWQINLLNLNALFSNELKKDQNIKNIISCGSAARKIATFDSSFNSVQSLNANLPILKEENKNISGAALLSNPKILAILRATGSLRLSRDQWKLVRMIKGIIPSLQARGWGSSIKNTTKANFLCESELSISPLRSKSLEKNPKFAGIKKGHNTQLRSYYKTIINSNLLLRNRKYHFIKSTLSTILKKRIKTFASLTSLSEILENKPNKSYINFQYIKNCLFAPQTKISSLASTQGDANKYKGYFASSSANGSFLNYNKIISYNFNSNLYSANFQVASKLKKTNGSFAKATITNNNNIDAQMPKVSTGSSYQGSPAFAGLTVPPLAKLSTTELKVQNHLQRLTSLGGAKANSSNLIHSRIQINPNHSSSIYIKDTYKLLFFLFKSMYCLISKPVLKYTNDKVTIQLFYYLNIPKKKVFRLFSILYIDSIKKKWFASLKKSNNKLVASLRSKSYPMDTSQYQHPKIYIRWKLRKAISRLLLTAARVAEASESNKNQNIAVASAQAKCTNLLFNLRKFSLTKVFQPKFKLICDILSNKFNKPVELELTRLHHPYHDSNILVNLLSLNIKNKRKKARVAIQKVYSKKPVKFLNDPNLISVNCGAIPTFLSGLNIKIAGRLMGEPIIPRVTTKVFEKGATATGKVNYLDVARITKKNKKGAYTIKITSGQNFF
jgi:hypothetical protein